jgi:uracil-DNA glycosylase
LVSNEPLPGYVNQVFDVAFIGRKPSAMTNEKWKMIYGKSAVALNGLLIPSP